MITIPRRGRGRQSQEAVAKYTVQLVEFADALQQINSRLDFKVGSRGWCYVLEEHGLVKGDFDKAECLINDCRKSGLLPIDFTANDENREAEGIQDLYGFDESPTEHAQAIISTLPSLADCYTPESFWTFQDVYVEMMVEKIDLKSLFGNICAEYYIPITNSRGWADINSRAALVERFKHWEYRGKQCVLLYCGDHDPGGLNISDAIRANLADLSQATGWRPDSLIINRFGLNHDFIVKNRLSWINNLETSSGKRLDDPKHADHYKPYVQDYLKRFGARKVEANALVVRPDAGRELCRQAINKYVAESAIDEYNGYLNGKREQVRQHIAELMGGLQ